VKLCRHCNERNGTKGRGLCWKCAKDPEIKALYPSTSKFAVRGIPDGFAARPCPPEPTGIPQGTEDRIKLYRQRLEAGFHWSHEHDTKAIQSERTGE